MSEQTTQNEVRLIDANAFIEDIKTEAINLFMDGMKGTPRDYRGLYDIIDRIGEQPTIDAEPVRHGKWIKTRKHIWKKNEDGEIDEWAWDYEFHNGVCCEICHESPCVHCEPGYDEKQDCREHYICSECGRMVLALEPYCHCGAKMDGGTKDG